MLQVHFFHRPPPEVTKGRGVPQRRSAVAVAGEPHPMQTDATPGSDAWLSALDQAGAADGQKAAGFDAGVGGGDWGTGQLGEEGQEGWEDAEEGDEEIGIGCHTLGVQGRWHAEEWQGPEEEEDFEGHGWGGVGDGWGQDYADDNDAEGESEFEADPNRAWEQAERERLRGLLPAPRVQHQQQQQQLLTRLLDDQAAVSAGLPPQLPTPLAQEGARQLLQEGPRQLQQVSPADKNKAHEEYMARRQEMLRRKEEWLKVGGCRG